MNTTSSRSWEEILTQVRRIDLRTERDVNGPFAGGYRALSLGRGMDFEEVREYAPGDEVRLMDWNVTARSGRAHVKRFREEREHNMMLLVDLSASGSFGSVVSSKRETMALIASAIAFSALKNGDRIGLVMFTHRIERVIPPRKGKQAALRMIKELLTFTPTGIRTDPAVALTHVLATQKKRATVFVLSDLAVEGATRARMMSALQEATVKHEIVAIEVRDRAEEALPDVGTVIFQDAESEETVVVDTHRARDEYAALAKRRHAETAGALADVGIAHAVIRTDEDALMDLERFFDRRRKRRRR